jgi:hypothetical protein
MPYIVYNIKHCIYGSPSNSIAEADCVVINSDEITYADAVILSIESYEQEEERRSNNNGSISNVSSSNSSSNSSIAEGKEDSDSSTTDREGPNESDRNKSDSYYTTNILVEARWIDVSLE